jgi:hypothetical protein
MIVRDRSSHMLHVVPGDSAAGTLLQAVRATGREDQIASFIDDLSCGPIDSDEPSARLAWWTSVHHERQDHITGFWDRIASATERLVVWFGRHSALEHAFFLALADRLGDRAFDMIDVTGMQLPVTLSSGLTGLSHPKQSVSLMSVDHLASLFGTERAITAGERDAAARCWHRLKSENAPFRVVTETGLVSAPAEIFDDLLLERASKDWRSVAKVIGDTIGYNMEPYIQTGDVMLLARVAALIAEGKLAADGDPWDMWKCRVRLTD